MPRLNWNEVKARAIRFSREWSDATSERADKQTFYNEFFDVFGIRRASVAIFEANVRNLHGNTSAIDLLWRSKLIVEHKSRGESLDQAETQAFTYIEDLTREGRFDEVPRFVLVSDFASFVLYDLEPEEQRNLPLFAGCPRNRNRNPARRRQQPARGQGDGLKFSATNRCCTRIERQLCNPTPARNRFKKPVVFRATSCNS